MDIQFLSPKDCKDISTDLLQPNGYMKLHPAAFYKELHWQDFRLFCHDYARYGIPTTELITFLKDEIIKDRSVIEIGAGAGDLGHHLGIHMTDSKIQQRSDIKRVYAQTMQPVIQYPADVEKIDALDAVIKHKPQVVIGSWITTYAPHQMPYGSNPNGIKEKEILDLVDTFILIGNLAQHWDKPIMDFPHVEIKNDFLVSRAKNQEKNRIWIWNT